MTAVYSSFAGVSASSKVIENQGVSTDQMVELPIVERLPEYLVIHCAENGLSLKRASALYCGKVDQKSIFELEYTEFYHFVRQSKLWAKLNDSVRQECLDNLQNETWVKPTKQTRGAILLSKLVLKQQFKLTKDRTMGKGSAKEPLKAKPYKRAFPKLLRGSQSHIRVQSDYRDALDSVQETLLYWCRSATGKEGFAMDSNEDDKLVILAEKGSISHMSFGMSRFKIMSESRRHSQKVSRCSYRDRLGQNAKLLNYRDILIDHCNNIIESSDNKKRKEDPYVTYCRILLGKLENKIDQDIAEDLGLSRMTVHRIWTKFQSVLSARVSLLVDYQNRIESKAIRETITSVNEESGLHIVSTYHPVPTGWDNKGFLGQKVSAQRADGTIPQNDGDSVEVAPLPIPTISHRIGRGKFAWGWVDCTGIGGGTPQVPYKSKPIPTKWETKNLTISSYGYGDDVEDQQYGTV